jgi:hypothetical protein
VCRGRDGRVAQPIVALPRISSPSQHFSFNSQGAARIAQVTVAKEQNEEVFTDRSF